MHRWRAGRRWLAKALPCVGLLLLVPTLALAQVLPVEEDGFRLFVKDIRIANSKVFAESQLKLLVADFVGQELSVGDLQNAAFRIAAFYRARGYASRAVLPQQTVRDGVVHLAVVEGKRDPAMAEETADAGADQNIASMIKLSRARFGEPLSLADAEGAVPLVGEAPAAPTKLAKATGDSAAASRANVLREQRRIVDFIAARYRVSHEAVAPVVVTAYQAGQESAVDPLLILAVIAIESSFNPTAESVVGAKGLMQVMAKFHMEKIALHGDEGVLLDPAANIRVGTRILREYLRRFGETEAALQKYAGAANDPNAAYARKVLTERSRIEQNLVRLRREV